MQITTNFTVLLGIVMIFIPRPITTNTITSFSFSGFRILVVLVEFSTLVAERGSF
ncbi:hypothetical protein AADEFJLK_04260 [Methylovulum psychrotolerans]|uniref:Uncharacterized protein n=1 Tax=Methylovulum psychrotolerans TaxID=1704499 RepID=A0A2S5CGQ4_9GAMM|nr:hypothetical protein AADEFJLK_04260 [Methylovulum psychrotolerans]